MFNCQVCGKSSKPREKCHLILAKRKKVSHPFRSSANQLRNLETRRIDYIADSGGIGWQIVKELRACERCKHYSPLADEPEHLAEAAA